MLGIDTPKGHRAGADKTEEMLDWAHELGIKHITLYTFSTENFSRNKEEVDHLFALFREKFISVLNDERVKRYKIRVQMVGDRSLLPPELKDAVDAAEEATKDNKGFHLNIALAYGEETRSCSRPEKYLPISSTIRSRPGESMLPWWKNTFMGAKGSPRLTLSSGQETSAALQTSSHGSPTAMNPRFTFAPHTGLFSGKSTSCVQSASTTSVYRRVSVSLAGKDRVLYFCPGQINSKDGRKKREQRSVASDSDGDQG
jgi:hypothetical protein